ncbi:MAG: phospho-N-acetylmuramoyl-pentapeptide-transferase [Clostridiales bacterium]|nr:phospho-N-acetylmuramoyl-pentapeptide-transferase [Clostridiales bacterium]
MKTYLLSALTAFALSLVFCFALIPILRRLKAGQNILVYLKEHKKKSGTPTMGGIAFILATVISSAVFIRDASRDVFVTVVIGLAYMAVGLLDDYLKHRHKENLGLKAWQKFSFQAIIALFVGVFCLRSGLTFLYLPFTDKYINIGFFALPLTLFVFLATVNAVNLTDGLDGLAAGTSVPFFLAFGILIHAQSQNTGQGIVCFCVVGALCAYLLFNSYPASVFMGDTGSLSLGGIASCVATFTGNALYVAIIGVMFVLSVISVLLQVIYYKVTGGKRIFLMAPIHHHFQKKGYSEGKIAYAYAIITAVLGVICICGIL